MSDTVAVNLLDQSVEAPRLCTTSCRRRMLSGRRASWKAGWGSGPAQSWHARYPLFITYAASRTWLAMRSTVETKRAGPDSAAFSSVAQPRVCFVQATALRISTVG